MLYKALFLILISLTLVIFALARMKPAVRKGLIQIGSVHDIEGIFPASPAEIKQRQKAYTQDVQAIINQLKHVPDEKRTFANTAQALDDAVGKSDLVIFISGLSAIKYLHQDEKLRNAAEQALSEISAFLVDITSDKQLYKAFKAYVEGNAQRESLSDEQRYYLEESMKDFIRMGLELPDDQLEQVKKIQKELTDLELLFSKNINSDKTTIEVTKEQLDGTPEDFIASLKRAENGNYILGVDYPTMSVVLEKAKNVDTRKRFSTAFNNRAYPANEQVLKDIIAKRDELANLLGFASYAHLDLDDQMVGSPERALDFINTVINRADVKEALEYEMLKKDLPESVSLDASGKFYPWDTGYAWQVYKQKHFDIDEQKIAEYFPVAKTIDGLFAIYQQLFSLQFKEVPVKNLWHDDLSMLEVHDAGTHQLLGYIILDLYPRPDKYSHAAHLRIIPAVISPDGKENYAVSIIMANFPKAQGDKPPLFKRSDVITFFHEFGHALHSLLGRTHLASFSGTQVKRDFVELPSQMLEEWMRDKNILKQISSHYITGQPLPDATVDNILKLKNLSIGSHVQRQGMLAKLALEYFKPGSDKAVNEIYRSLKENLLTHLAYNPDDHMFAAFGHLTGYGAKYYGYLWSQVFALDLFAEFKKAGLLNPEIGKQYVQKVLSRGGSADPNQLLRDFLGREPNDKAFFEDMGL